MLYGFCCYSIFASVDVCLLSASKSPSFVCYTIESEYKVIGKPYLPKFESIYFERNLLQTSKLVVF